MKQVAYILIPAKYSKMVKAPDVLFRQSGLVQDDTSSLTLQSPDPDLVHIAGSGRGTRDDSSIRCC